MHIPGLADAFRAFGDKPTEELSFNKIFATLGIMGWRRRNVRIRSRVPTEEESWRLRIPATEHVLETEVISVMADDTPLIYANTCYASSRVEFVVDPSENDTR